MSTKKLEDYSRKQLDCYMIDCHGFEAEEVIEWETKADLCADIRAFGWQTEALEYLT